MILNLNQQCHGVCVFEGSIITAVESKGIVTLFLYQEINGSLDKNDFKTIVLGIVRDSAFGTDKSLEIDQQAIIMYIMTTEQSRNRSNSVFSNVLCINNTLFQQLFGSEVSLLRSPVRLISLPNGNVSYAAFNQFERVQVADSILSNSRTAHATFVGLCEMSVGVPFVLVSECSGLTTPSEHEQQSSDLSPCLLVLDRSGSAVLFTPDDSSTLPVISKAMVDGPIKAVCSVADKVYVSTRRHILEYTFHINNREGALLSALSITNVMEYRNVIQIKMDVKKGFFTVSGKLLLIHVIQKHTYMSFLHFSVNL